MKSYDLKLQIKNRWRKSYGWGKPFRCVIWLGHEFISGSEYQHIINQWSFDITVVNIGLSLTIIGKPQITGFAWECTKGKLQAEGNSNPSRKDILRAIKETDKVFNMAKTLAENAMKTPEGRKGLFKIFNKRR